MTNKEIEYIIILDFSTGQVYIKEYDSNIVDSYEEFYEILNEEYDLNLSDSNCQCMISKNKLNITLL